MFKRMKNVYWIFFPYCLLFHKWKLLINLNAYICSPSTLYEKCEWICSSLDSNCCEFFVLNFNISIFVSSIIINKIKMFLVCLACQTTNGKRVTALCLSLSINVCWLWVYFLIWYICEFHIGIWASMFDGYVVVCWYLVVAWLVSSIRLRVCPFKSIQCVLILLFFFLLLFLHYNRACKYNSNGFYVFVFHFRFYFLANRPISLRSQLS